MCSIAMTVGAYNFALCHLSSQGLYRNCFNYHSRNTVNFILIDMVEVHLPGMVLLIAVLAGFVLLLVYNCLKLCS